MHLYRGGFSGMCNHNLLIVVNGPHMRSGDRRHRSILISYLRFVRDVSLADMKLTLPESAADGFAGYLILQFGREPARRLITTTWIE